MSTTNNAILFLKSQAEGASTVEVSSSAAASQGTATRLTNNLSRCKQAVSTGSFILPSILSGEASREMWLVNDSAVAVNVYPAKSEKVNGNVDTALSVPAGQTGLFIPILASTYVYPSPLNWNAVTIS
jgi:hypothetical protein